MPLFSVIMPAYNAVAYIDEAIQSVIRQSFDDWELLIVNDGSTDDTADIVSVYCGLDSRIKLVNQENKRLGAARNTGIQHASGKWIAFLDSDDIWLENKLLRQNQMIESYPDVDVIFSDGYSLFEDTKLKLPYHFQVAKGLINGNDMYHYEFAGNKIPVLSAMVKKKWVELIGEQDESIEVIGCEDWDYWLRLSKAGATFMGMNDKLFIYRVHKNSMSSKLLIQQLSSFNILYKNIVPDVIKDHEIRSLRNFGLHIHKSLHESGEVERAQRLLDRLVGLYEKSFWSKLLHIFGARRIFRLMTGRKNTGLSLITRMKYGFKKILLETIEYTLFSIIKKFNKHKHNFTIQYHRWLLGQSLETRGYFYMHPTAQIKGDAGSKLITYGLSINDYSIINIGKMVTGKDVVINKFCHFNIWNGKVLLGNNVLFNNYCSLNCMEEIEIGDNTWFGEGVKLYDHNHKFKDKSVPFTEQGFSTSKIKIGSNVWIGSNTVILQNVEIGDNAVIGANNLIYKSVSANSIVKAKAMEIIE